MSNWDKVSGSLRIETLRPLYASKAITPSEVLEAIFQRIDAYADKTVWISFFPRDVLRKRVKDLEAEWNANDANKARLSLYGIFFAVKDNIDCKDIATTAACPEFSYMPTESATTVKQLESVGCVVIGKTNLDQFASGLVGVRSPYGIPHSVFSKEHVSGGSSSGSGVAVSAGLVSFALGTDTAGSGRVPAAFNNVVGLKPTKGVLSAKGVVPACRILDCVSVFALTCEDAHVVFKVVHQHSVPVDDDDRTRDDLVAHDKRHHSITAFKFGVPKKDQLKFFGNAEYERLYYEAADRLSKLGGERVGFDFAPFNEAALMLYQSAPLAERLAYLEDFFKQHPDAGLPIIKVIVENGYKFSAVEAYRSIWRLQAIRKQVNREVFGHLDFVLLPTVGTHYKISEIQEHPITLNANLGYYTNFVNLLDLSAVAIPNGFTTAGLPMGITIVGKALNDEYLLSLGAKYERTLQLQFGNTGHKY